MQPANGTSLRALYAWRPALADRAAVASTRRGLPWSPSYQAREPAAAAAVLRHPGHYFRAGERGSLSPASPGTRQPETRQTRNPLHTTTGYDFRGREGAHVPSGLPFWGQDFLAQHHHNALPLAGPGVPGHMSSPGVQRLSLALFFANTQQNAIFSDWSARLFFWRRHSARPLDPLRCWPSRSLPTPRMPCLVETVF